MLIVVASTRPGRVGPSLAAWFRTLMSGDQRFAVDFVDLFDLNLPFLDERHHPRLRRYAHEHTISWSRRVEKSDAFVLIMPEYNHGYTAPLKNALDYLHHEWAHKPVGFVSYGGIAAGTRAVQALKPVLIALRMAPTVGAVHIAFVKEHIDAEGQFVSNSNTDDMAHRMVDELARLESSLRDLQAASSPDRDRTGGSGLPPPPSRRHPLEPPG